MNVKVLVSTLFTIACSLSTVAVAAGPLTSPCDAGEVGEGANCMFLTMAGDTYNPLSGTRFITGTPTTIAIDVWIDFDDQVVRGGGFDITYNTSQVVDESVSWAWSPEMADSATVPGAPGVTGWEGIQFDDFGGNGFGGTTGSLPGFMMVGTLTLTLEPGASLSFGISQPYGVSTFPNCFAPADTGMFCVMTSFFGLQVSTDASGDTDGDGIPDTVDNCTMVANANQRDTNGDGFGNLCDADFDGNCSINFTDLQQMRDNFFGTDDDTDLNGDNSVNFADLNLLRASFFGMPGPSGLTPCIP